MSFMKGVLGEHIGESEDVRKIVLATVTAWKDSSTQRYLKGIVDPINAIHKDDPARQPPPQGPRRQQLVWANCRKASSTPTSTTWGLPGVGWATAAATTTTGHNRPRALGLGAGPNGVDVDVVNRFGLFLVRSWHLGSWRTVK